MPEPTDEQWTCYVRDVWNSFDGEVEFELPPYMDKAKVEAILGNLAKFCKPGTIIRAHRRGFREGVDRSVPPK